MKKGMGLDKAAHFHLALQPILDKTMNEAKRDFKVTTGCCFLHIIIWCYWPM